MKINLEIRQYNNEFENLKKLVVVEEKTGDIIHTFYGKHGWIECLTIAQLGNIEFIVNAILREIESRDCPL